MNRANLHVVNDNSKRRGSQSDGRKGVLVRLPRRAWLQLKNLAAEETLRREEMFSMQAALEEALDAYFRKHGLAECAGGRHS